MKLIIDLDGTICPIRQPHENYADLPVLPGAAEKIKEFRRSGHYVVIQTARNMGTQQSNLGKVMKNIGKITLDWLDRNGIEYDEIYFGKPNGDVYIDDRAFRFENWNSISEETLSSIAKEK